MLMTGIPRKCFVNMNLKKKTFVNSRDSRRHGVSLPHYCKQTSLQALQLPSQQHFQIIVLSSISSSIQLLTMAKAHPVIRTLVSTALWGSAIGITSFAVATRSSKFVPFTPSDPILSSAAYIRNNPNRNPGTSDLCVRKVPLAQLKADLVEGAAEGKLIEQFCAGVWSGLGESFYLREDYREEGG